MKSASEGIRSQCVRIGITTGEPAGIGPDIVVKLVLGGNDSETVQLTIIGDRDVLVERSRMLGYGSDFENAVAGDSGITLLHVKTEEPVVAGYANPRNASHVLGQIDAAITGCVDGTLDAMVTSPVNKNIISQSEGTFPGHTEYLAAACERDTVMMLTCKAFRVALATTHIPLKQVSQSLSIEGLKRTLKIVHKDLFRLFGIARPRIAVCGCNPHAGENGRFGDEEERVIRPAIEALIHDNPQMRLSGPLPADTAFTPRHLRQCDAIVTMYHDQGLPVIKHAAFGRAVNVTLGLPFVRTSVDHGTALSIAGSGKAVHSSLDAAVTCAAKLTRMAGRKQQGEQTPT